MAIVNGYATLEELEAWTGEKGSSLTPIYEQAVETASRQIDAFCARRFYPAADEARVFDVAVTGDVTIDDATEVTAVATDDNRDGTFETAWSASDWQAIAPRTYGAEQWPYRRIRAVGSRSWPAPRCGGRVGLVEVTADWGWDTVPDAVHQACLVQASRLLKRRDSPEGVAGFGEFGVVRVTRVDADVEALLMPYRAAVLVA